MAEARTQPEVETPVTTTVSTPSPRSCDPSEQPSAVRPVKADAYCLVTTTSPSAGASVGSPQPPPRRPRTRPAPAPWRRRTRRRRGPTRSGRGSTRRDAGPAGRLDEPAVRVDDGRRPREGERAVGLGCRRGRGRRRAAPGARPSRPARERRAVGTRRARGARSPGPDRPRRGGSPVSSSARARISSSGGPMSNTGSSAGRSSRILIRSSAVAVSSTAAPRPSGASVVTTTPYALAPSGETRPRRTRGRRARGRAPAGRPTRRRPGDEVQDVAGGDGHVVALGGKDLPGAVGALDPLGAAGAGAAAVDAPRVGEPAVVVDGDGAGLLEDVGDVDAVAAAVQAGAAGVGDGLPLLDPQR